MMPAAPAFAGATMALADQKFEGGRSGGTAALFISALDHPDAPVGCNRPQRRSARAPALAVQAQRGLIPWHPRGDKSYGLGAGSHDGSEAGPQPHGTRAEPP